MTTTRLRRVLIRIGAILVCVLGITPPAAAATYEQVENWAQLPPGTRWSQAISVDIDAHGTVYVFHRGEMPIRAFEGNGRFLRAWGQGLFTMPHFLRTDPHGNIWATDVGAHQIFKFSAEGTLLMTLGKKGINGDNESKDAFNGPADVVIAPDGSIFIADGQSSNTRVVKYSKDGTFVKYWGGKGTEPGKFDVPHSIAMDSTGRLYVADRQTTGFIASIRTAPTWTNGPTSGHPRACSSPRTICCTSSMDAMPCASLAPAMAASWMASRG